MLPTELVVIRLKGEMQTNADAHNLFEDHICFHMAVLHCFRSFFFNVTLPSVPLSHPPLPLSHSGIQLNHHRAGRNSLLSSPEETHHVLWDCRLPKQPQGDGYRSVSATAHKTNKYSTVTALHSNTPKAIHPDPSNRCKICFGFSVVVHW